MTTMTRTAPPKPEMPLPPGWMSPADAADRLGMTTFALAAVHGQFSIVRFGIEPGRRGFDPDDCRYWQPSIERAARILDEWKAAMDGPADWMPLEEVMNPKASGIDCHAASTVAGWRAVGVRFRRDRRSLISTVELVNVADLFFLGSRSVKTDRIRRYAEVSGRLLRSPLAESPPKADMRTRPPFKPEPPRPRGRWVQSRSPGEPDTWISAEEDERRKREAHKYAAQMAKAREHDNRRFAELASFNGMGRIINRG